MLDISLPILKTEIPYFAYLTYLVYGIIALLLLYAIWIPIRNYRRRREAFAKSLSYTLLMVRMPKSDDEQKKEGLVKQINLTEQLFAAFGKIEETVVFEAAVAHTNELINFYVSVPKSSVDFITRQIQGLFPNSKVDPIEDYNIFGHQSEAVAAYLISRESYMLPFRTYKEAEIDTFAPIINTFSKLQAVGEGASIQVIIRPAPKNTKSVVVWAIEEMKKGMPLKKALKLGTFNLADIAKNFGKALFKGIHIMLFPSLSEKKEKEKTVDDDGVKALQTKISKQLFEVNVRLMAAAQTEDQAEDILLSAAGAFSQFAAPVRNELKMVKVDKRSLKNTIFDYSFRMWNDRQKMILNTEEIASIFHMPTYTTDVPRIVWLKTREAPPPADLPAEGAVIGESIFRGDHRLVRMSDDDRRRHTYIIGQTGTGKSRTMLNLALQDIKQGKGCCLIDPHGEFAEDTLQRIPKDRINDVIVFDPGDLSRPLGINMLEYDFNRPEQRTFIVNEMQSIFNQLFDKASMGPMFEQYMRNTLLLLMEDAVNEPCTLMEIPRIFSDDDYRNRKLARISNLTVIDFWEKEAAKATGDWSLANMGVYISSKFSNFLSNDYMRPIIAQVHSSFNFREVMDQRKILLINLSKGKIGDLNSSLLGMIIIGKLLMAALSRADTTPDKRPDFFLYIDEMQNYTTDAIATILSEARKYGLCLSMAHQFLGQLKENIRDAVFGNVGSMLVYRIEAKDAEVFLKQMSPEFDLKDLVSFETRNCAARILVNGQPCRPFTMKALTTEPGIPDLKEKLKELSRLTYGTPLEQIERDIAARLRL